MNEIKWVETREGREWCATYYGRKLRIVYGRQGDSYSVWTNRFGGESANTPVKVGLGGLSAAQSWCDERYTN